MTGIPSPLPEGVWAETHRDVTITGNWNPENLITSGRQWRRRLLS